MLGYFNEIKPFSSHNVKTEIALTRQVIKIRKLGNAA